MTAPTPAESGRETLPGATRAVENELAALRQQLAEAEELIAAIRNGDVDALVVGTGGQERVYTLESAETPYRHFVHEMQEGALTIAQDGTILYTNPCFAALVELAPEQVVGRSLRDFFAEPVARWWAVPLRTESTLCTSRGRSIPVAISVARLPGDDARRACLVVTDLRSTQQMAALAASQAAVQAAHERLQAQAAELTAANRELEAHAAAQVARTEQLRAQSEQVFAANQRLEALMNALPVGVSYSAEPTCRRITGNAAFLAQFDARPPGARGTSADLAADWGRTLGVYAEGRALAAHEIPLQRAVAENREIPPSELEIVLPSGRRWVALASAAPIRESRGRAVGGIAVWVDITRLKELERERAELMDSERAARSEAERMARLKDEFLATLSHELRTPLAAILGWSQLLRRDRELSNEVAEAVKVIEDNARLQKQLIEDLLDMSRIVSGKMKLDAQPVELAIVAEEAVAMFRPAAAAKGLALETRLAGLTGQVLGDAGRLKQVIGNLLSNAIKFTPAGGRVRVTGRSRAGRALLAVQDTGIGIAPAFLPYLFERFRQADASTTRKYRGLGLGLALVKQLIELHQGTVRARSRGEGRGATFVLGLPLLDALDRLRELPAAPLACDVELAGVTALVVDDEPTTRALIARILREAGAAVTDCGCAATALESLRARPYDVIVSDISMPGEDGYSLLRRIRQLPDPRRAATPALALSAFSRSDDRRRSFEAGYQTHLTKPVDAAELCAVVANLTRRTAGSA